MQKAKAETETYIKDRRRQVTRGSTLPMPRRCSTLAPSTQAEFDKLKAKALA